MKYSLRAARKLENKIKTSLDKPFELTLSLDAFDTTDVSSRMLVAGNTAKKALAHSLRLINIRSTIRRAVQETNETSGINTLIGKRKAIIDRTTTLQDVVKQTELHKFLGPESTQRRLEVIRESGKTTGIGYRDTVEVPVISSQLLLELKEELKLLIAQLEELDETILSRNTSTKIEVSDDDIAFLKEVGIL